MTQDTTYEARGVEVFVTYRGRTMRYVSMPTIEDAQAFASLKNGQAFWPALTK